MKLNACRIAGKRAIAVLAATAVISTGVVALDPVIAQAQEYVSATGKEPRGQVSPDHLSITPQVEAGGTVDVTLTDMPTRPAKDAFVGIRLNDGDLKLGPQPSGEGNPENADDRGDVYYNVEGGASNATFKLDIPADLKPGYYWLRILGGNDGGDAFSWYNWFEVVDPNAPAEPSAVPEGSSVAVSSVATQADTSAQVGVDVSGFEAGETITAKVGDTAASFQAGRSTAAEVTADDKGAYTGTVVVPAGTAVAGESYTLTLTGSKGTTAETTFEVQPSMSLDNTSANGELNASVGNLPEGAVVEKLGTAANNWLSEPITAADGVATASGLTISDEPGAEIIAEVRIGDKTVTVNSGSKVTGDASALNAHEFDTQRLDLASGLYQSAYSPKSDSLFVTRAVGRPPIKESTLYKVNPNTMEVVAQVTPDAVEGTEGLYAVYGVGVDDVHNAVWVTNTRQNTVAVYSQDDLSLINQFDADSTGHSRDVVIDEETGLAYVSSPRSAGGYIDIYDIEKGKIGSIQLGDDFGSTMALDLNQETGELFTVSLENPKAAKIDLRNDNAATIYDVDGLDTGSGVAFVPSTRELWVVGQNSSEAIAINVDSGEVANRVTIGAGALNAEYEPVSNTVFVVNRADGTVTVIGAATHKILGQLADEPGGLVNHLEADGKGNVFSVNKASEGEDGATTNRLVKITPKFKDEAPVDEDSSTDNNTGSTDDNTGNTGTDANTNNGGSTTANASGVSLSISYSLSIVFGNVFRAIGILGLGSLAFGLAGLTLLQNWITQVFVPTFLEVFGS
ncbi:MAG: hypothetical protein Q3976_08130 [Corynebacterium sp.]|nr:hypothetical protein [Corynebacterium sp.]